MACGEPRDYVAWQAKKTEVYRRGKVVNTIEKPSNVSTGMAPLV